MFLQRQMLRSMRKTEEKGVMWMAFQEKGRDKWGELSE
jgi:hypothetical protein